MRNHFFRNVPGILTYTRRVERHAAVESRRTAWTFRRLIIRFGRYGTVSQNARLIRNSSR